jgi:hypothetical protein
MSKGFSKMWAYLPVDYVIFFLKKKENETSLFDLTL